MARTMLFMIAVLAAVLLAAGCPAPTAPAPPSEPPGEEDGGGEEPLPTYLSGVVYDSVTGEPVAGTLLRFGGTSSETSADGSFSIPLGNTGAALLGSWLVFKDGYEFSYVDRVAIDSSMSWKLAIPVRRSDLSAYTNRTTIAGEVTFAAGGPLPEGSQFVLALYGSDGTRRHYQGVLSASGYSIDTTQDSSDCLLVMQMDPAAGTDFVVMAKADLSGLGPVELDLQEPVDGFMTVQATAARAGNHAACYFLTPYGAVPGLFKRGEEVRGEWEFGSEAEPLAVCNPFGWQQVVWIQSQDDDSFAGLPLHEKRFVSSSAPTQFSGTVVLPPVDSSLGPEAGADPASLQLVGPLLCLEAVAGAGMYSFAFSAGAEGEMTLGTVISFDAKVSLPEEITLALGGGAVQVSFQVLDSHLTCLDAGLLGAAGEFPPDLDVGMVRGSEEASYERSFDTIVIGIR